MSRLIIGNLGLGSTDSVSNAPAMIVVQPLRGLGSLLVYLMLDVGTILIREGHIDRL